MEEKALEKEKDKASVERLGEVRKEMSELNEELRPLQMRYRQVGGGAGEGTGGAESAVCMAAAAEGGPRCASALW